MCVFVAKRLLNNLYLIPFCTTWFITSVQIHQVLFVPHSERRNRLWQPVVGLGCVIKFTGPSASQYKIKTSRGTHSTLFTKDAHSLQGFFFFQFVFLKDKLLRNDSKCLHMYFKPSMKNTPFQKKKNRYKSGFSVCFSWKKRDPPSPPPTIKSKCVTAQYFFNSFILLFFKFNYTQGRIKVTKT